jgi:4-oxalocrotonate tautomerase
LTRLRAGFAYRGRGRLGRSALTDSRPMPLISIRLVKGRTDDQLRELVHGVSEAAAHALDVPVERIGVHVFELEPTHIGRGGRLVSDSQS